jgi:hypothetical protein
MNGADQSERRRAICTWRAAHHGGGAHHWRRADRWNPRRNVGYSNNRGRGPTPVRSILSGWRRRLDASMHACSAQDACAGAGQGMPPPRRHRPPPPPPPPPTPQTRCSPRNCALFGLARLLCLFAAGSLAPSSSRPRIPTADSLGAAARWSLGQLDAISGSARRHVTSWPGGPRCVAEP